MGAKSGAILDEKGKELQADCHMPLTLRYSNLCREAINIDSKVVANNEAYEVAVNGFHTTLKEVKLILKNLPLSFAVEIDEIVQWDGNSNLLRPLGDPTKMRHKGWTKRFKSFLDNPKKTRVGKTGRKS
ncbi:hypothetical protein Ancab_036694, partial [Ancistrocladus abbreviatus]